MSRFLFQTLSLALLGGVCVVSSAHGEMPVERTTGNSCPLPGNILGVPIVTLDNRGGGADITNNSSQQPGITRELKMPTLLTKSFYAPKDVCDDAKKNNPGKKFAIVAGKTHICDRESKACLKTLRDVSDTCNRFLQDNFAIYHTRLFRLRPTGGQKVAQEQVGSDEITEAWAKSGGPNLTVMSLSDCKVFPMSGPGLDSNKDPAVPSYERFRLMQEQVLRIPGLRDAMGTAAGYVAGDTEKNCLLNPEPTLDQAWNAVETQSEQIEKDKGAPQWVD